jgi:hypothetical protein
MMRRFVVAALFLAACEKSKPSADSAASLVIDTAKPAAVAAPDTVKPAPTPAAPTTVAGQGPTKAAKAPIRKTRAGTVGRDSAVVMDPKHPRTIRVDPPKPDPRWRDSAIVMDPKHPRTIRVDTTKKRDSLPR